MVRQDGHWATRARQACVGLLAVAGCASSPIAAPLAPEHWALSATPLERSAGELDNDVHEHLAWARAYRTRILAVEGRRTIQNTLLPYQEMMLHLDTARNVCTLFAQVSPYERVRAVAAAARQTVEEYLAGLSLDAELYEALRGVDLSRADVAARAYVDDVLRQFRHAGADRPEEVRALLADLRRETARLERQFAQNVRRDAGHIVVDSLADLDGLPARWIRAHPLGRDGKVPVPTSPDDYSAFMAYARVGEVRREMYAQYHNRGCPQNINILLQLLSKRYELARALGYADWVACATDGSTAGSKDDARKLIDRVAQACRAPSDREYETLCDRKRRDDPDASAVQAWDEEYYTRLVQSERLGLNPRAVREYFAYPNVLNGLCDVAEELFDVSCRRVRGLNLWHKDVTAWDVYEGGERLGRFFVDPYARPGKPQRTAFIEFVTGLAGVRIPQGVLIFSLPRPRSGGDGLVLMEPDQATPLAREFGRMLYFVLRGNQPWLGGRRVADVELADIHAQLFESLVFHPGVLPLLARHCRDNEPIPTEIAQAIGRAREFGKGLRVAEQVFELDLWLQLHGRAQDDLDPVALAAELQQLYGPFAHVEEVQLPCRLVSLDYETGPPWGRLWSRMESIDLLSAMDRRGVRDRATSVAYRRAVLEPSPSTDVAGQISDFLGRRPSPAALEAWLNHR